MTWFWSLWRGTGAGTSSPSSTASTQSSPWVSSSYKSYKVADPNPVYALAGCDLTTRTRITNYWKNAVRILSTILNNNHLLWKMFSCWMSDFDLHSSAYMIFILQIFHNIDVLNLAGIIFYNSQYLRTTTSNIHQIKWNNPQNVLQFSDGGAVYVPSPRYTVPSYPRWNHVKIFVSSTFVDMQVKICFRL